MSTTTVQAASWVVQVVLKSQAVQMNICAKAAVALSMTPICIRNVRVLFQSWPADVGSLHSQDSASIDPDWNPFADSQTTRGKDSAIRTWRF